jgi:hypothetical protein
VAKATSINAITYNILIPITSSPNYLHPYYTTKNRTSHDDPHIERWVRCAVEALASYMGGASSTSPGFGTSTKPTGVLRVRYTCGKLSGVELGS